MFKKKLPLLLAGVATLALTLSLVGCQEDLGDPVNRQADWDAVDPNATTGGTNSNNLLTEWLPECGIGAYYACPPYGLTRGDTFPNKYFAAGNADAHVWANEDGVFSLADYYQSEQKLLFLFYGRDG
ncbi:MAG: hypothetical protein ABI333_28180 [bacterium]